MLNSGRSMALNVSLPPRLAWKGGSETSVSETASDGRKGLSWDHLDEARALKLLGAVKMEEGVELSHLDIDPQGSSR